LPARNACANPRMTATARCRPSTAPARYATIATEIAAAIANVSAGIQYRTSHPASAASADSSKVPAWSCNCASAP
jgi:hypothetical protein